MGWFDEQIRQRAQRDQDVFEDSFVRMASAVLDKWNANRLESGGMIAKEALDDVLRYYREKPVEVPAYVAEGIERSQSQDEQSGAMMERLAEEYVRKTEEKTKPE